jgi:hypothetical protein
MQPMMSCLATTGHWKLGFKLDFFSSLPLTILFTKHKCTAVAQLADQSKTDSMFEGLNEATAGTGANVIKQFLSLIYDFL